MNLEAYLKSEIEKLLNQYRVPTWEDSKEGATFFAERPNQEDVFLNRGGAGRFFKMLRHIENLQHPKHKTPLKRIYGKSAIQTLIKDLVISRVRDFLAVSKVLLRESHVPWNIYIAIERINFDFEIDLGVARLFPPGLAFVPGKKNFISNFPHFKQHSYICIPRVKAPNLELAIEMGIERAKSALSLIPSGSESLILRKAPELNEAFAIGHRTGTKKWRISSAHGNRLVFFKAKKPAEVARAKVLGRIGYDLLKKIKSRRLNDGLLLRASSMYYSSKTVTDLPSKILLLVSCLECLLMDEFKKGKHSEEFTKRLQCYAKLRFTVNNDQRKFLANVYASRCRVAHAAQRVFEDSGNILFLETIIYCLLLDFIKAKKTVHVAILRELSIV